ncbi:chromosome segregation protein SMC [Schleiferilactobacillus harbinensis]|nr:chromosome segregation protein SMC [Schleiferilactobacillus harbinensis]
MGLTRLQLKGFKSFADTTTIEFSPGITGIVGPNGSGKSNLSESMRWVMGEQSAKGLRGNQMADVIFAGTELRPAVNMAEVTMVFDNHDHALKSNLPQLVVKRSLYVDGTSEYAINGKVCRLKDITDLFMDSGLGKGSFAIIGQGRVDEILNSKPETRRDLIEEVAGVYKYKVQKKQAEGQLATTMDNLNRVFDITHEIKEQLAPLAEQASIARDYQNQKSEYDKLNKFVLAGEITTLTQQQAAQADHLAELKGTQAKLEAAIKAGQADLATNQNEVATLDERLTAAQEDLLANSKQLEQKNGQLKLAQQQSDYAASTRAEKQEALAQAKAELAAVTKTLATQQAELAKQTAALAENQTAQDRLANGDDAGKDKLQQQLTDLRAQTVDALQQQATVRNALGEIKKQLARLGEDTPLEAVATAVPAALAKSDQDLSAAKQALAVAEETLAGTEHNHQIGQERLDARQKQWYAALEIYQQAKARLGSLQEINEDYGGFYAGAKAVLQNKAHLASIHGAVAELIKVPADYTTAIEMAAGGALQNIVVDTERSATQAINYLKQAHAGRATFLPMNVIQPRRIPANVLATVQTMPGFIGVASSLVDTLDRYRNIVDNLLGQLLIAQDLDTAVAIARASQHRYRIVTLAGDLINPGGSMSGGANKRNQSGVLARRAETDKLADQVKQMSAELDKRQSAIKELQTKLAGLSDDRTAQQAQVSQLRTTLAEQQEENHRLHEQDALAAQQRSLLAKQQDRQAQQRQELTSEQQDRETELARVTDQLAALKQQTAAVTDQINAAELSQSEKSERLSTLRDTEMQLSQTKARLDTQVATAQEQQAGLIAQVQQLTDFLTAKDAPTSHIDTAALQADITDLTGAIDHYSQQIKTWQQDKAKAAGAVSAAQAQVDRDQELRHQTLAEQEDVAVAVDRLKNQTNTRLASLSEDYSLSYEAVQADLPADFDLPATQKRVKLLKRGIDELGPVNLNAIADQERLQKRADFLQQQQDDLLAAKKQLETTMDEMDSAVADRFLATFQAVAKAFARIFPIMFGGGAAELTLTLPDDLLHTGVDITAQPPGKKLQQLSLLSGGERALTAITLLFAILQVRPAPFCVLDEVEASLDDANIDRFAHFLQQYQKHTQFIVITHRRGTMVAADRLYGVTMQESGVSKMVSVSLKEFANS